MQITQTHAALSDAPALDRPTPGRLGAGQIVIVAALAIFYWFLAALFIRFTLPAGWFAGAAGVAMFALTVPGAWLLVRSVRRVGGLRPDQLVAGVAVADAAALLCDGVAFTWFPTLYGAPDEDVRLGAAWLLWGVGVTLALAVARGQTDRR